MNAIKARDHSKLMELADAAITATQEALQQKLPKLMLDTLADCGKAAATRLKATLENLWYDPSTGIDDHGRGDRSPKDANKIAAAKASHKPSTAAKQRWAEGNEKTVSSMVQGKGTTGNAPVDVTFQAGRQQHGIEVKTLLEGERDKITMHPESKDRKERWASKNKAIIHTVVLDDRKMFGSGGYSGHRLYYRRGVGSFRLHGMTKVKSAAHLRELMSAKAEE